MATHSSVLAWRIPGTGEPGGLPSMGSHRVGHDWSDLAAAHKFKGRFLLKFCIAITTPGSTQATFLKPWANQCIFPKEMFFLSYVNELCICPRLCLSSSHFLLRDSEPIMAQQTSTFYSFIVLLIYVNESIYLLGNLPFFKIHVNPFMAQENSPCASVISKCMLWVRGLEPVSEPWEIYFLQLAAC